MCLTGATSSKPQPRSALRTTAPLGLKAPATSESRVPGGPDVAGALIITDSLIGDKMQDGLPAQLSANVWKAHKR